MGRAGGQGVRVTTGMVEKIRVIASPEVWEVLVATASPISQVGYQEKGQGSTRQNLK
jgi:hypothetical protein